MNEGEALLAAVRAGPDDDVARLVYADWLEERDGMRPCPDCHFQRPGKRSRETPSGGVYFTKCKTCDGTNEVPNRYAERAEFIRVQCELGSINAALDECAKADISAFDPQRAIPARRQKELRERELKLWHPIRLGLQHGLAPIVPLIRRDRRNDIVSEHAWFEFERGFARSVELSWADWYTHFRGILAHPAVVLRRVVFTDMPVIGIGRVPNVYHLYHLFNRIVVGQLQVSRGVVWKAGMSQQEVIREILAAQFPGHCVITDARGTKHYHPVEWVLPPA